MKILKSTFDYFKKINLGLLGSEVFRQIIGFFFQINIKNCISNFIKMA